LCLAFINIPIASYNKKRIIVMSIDSSLLPQHLITAPGQPSLHVFRYREIGESADAMAEDTATAKPLASPYWQLKLLLVTLLGLGAIATMVWLAVLGHFELHKAMDAANENMTTQQCTTLFYYILGGEAAALAVFGAAYKKLHHSFAKFYALLADNPLGKRLGLRTHAGRWGMLSRSIRTIAAIAYIGLITIAVMSGDIAAGIDALMLPYQAIIAVTWLGIVPGIVSNNAKIEQFYTAESRLLDSVNLALQQLSEQENWNAQERKAWEDKYLTVGSKIPHGMRALCNTHRQDLFTSLFIRKVHDVNSIIGSLLSVTRVIATIAAVSSFSIPPVFFAIVIGSSILSSFVAWYTNRSRLQANRNLLLDIQNDWLTIQKKLEPNRVQKAEALAESIFNDLGDTKPTNPFISKAILFHLTKALLEYYVTADSNTTEEEIEQRLKSNLVNLLKAVIKPDQPAGFLTRHINRDQHNTRYGLAHAHDSFTELSQTESITTSSIDGLFVLEELIVKGIINCKNNSRQPIHTTEGEQAGASPASASVDTMPQQGESEFIDQSSTISFDEQYKSACKLLSENITSIDPKHLHSLAFGLVTAYHRKQKYQHEQQDQEFQKAVNYITTNGFLTKNGLNESEVTTKHRAAVEDPHGNQPLQPSITKMCEDAFVQNLPAPAMTA
jgi:hypothetical protein